MSRVRRRASVNDLTDERKRRVEKSRLGVDRVSSSKMERSHVMPRFALAVSASRNATLVGKARAHKKLSLARRRTRETWLVMEADGEKAKIARGDDEGCEKNEDVKGRGREEQLMGKRGHRTVDRIQMGHRSEERKGSRSSSREGRKCESFSLSCQTRRHSPGSRGRRRGGSGSHQERCDPWQGRLKVVWYGCASTGTGTAALRCASTPTT